VIAVDLGADIADVAILKHFVRCKEATLNLIHLFKFIVPNLEKRRQASSLRVRKIASTDGRLRTAVRVPGCIPRQRTCVLAEPRNSHCHMELSLEP
jgi:hypothetical protein